MVADGIMTTRGANAAIALFALLALTSCRTTRLETDELTRARFLLESASRDSYSALVAMPISRVQVPVEGEAILSEYDYESIELVELELGKALLFTLKPAAARAFYRITVANQGKRLVLLVDAEPVGARRIDGPIADGRIHIFLEATDAELRRLAANLKITNLEIQKKLSR